MMKQITDNKPSFLINLLGFILLQLLMIWMLFIFFNNINPLIPYNSDDWVFLGGISSFRPPYPDISAWNPIKVFPEILQPLSGLFAAYVIYPLSHNYLDSLTMSMAICTAFMIWCLFFSFYKFIKDRFHTVKSTAVFCQILFALSFFGIFKQYERSSLFGFWAIDVTCIYHYILTGVINACLVLYILKFENFNEAFHEFSPLKKGLLVLWGYLSIFSSIQISHILAFTCFVLFMIVYFKSYKTLSVVQILKSCSYYVYIGIIWILSLGFEFFGGRSSNISSYSDGFFNHPFSETIEKFLELFRQFNKVYFIFFLFFAAGALLIAFISKKKEASLNFQVIAIMLASSFLSLLYLLLLYTKIPSDYANRADAQWTIIFWIITICISSSAYILQNKPKVWIVYPLILFILGSIALNPFTKFKSINANPEFAKNVNHYIMETIETAVENGDKDVEIHFPIYPLDLTVFDNSNDPNLYNTYYNDIFSGFLANTLYEHGITPTRLHITIVGGPSLNEEFYGSTYDERYSVNQ